MFSPIQSWLSIGGRTLAAIAAGTALAVSTAASAMSLSPMVAEITVDGAGSSARIQIGNESDQPLPYETHITRVDFDEYGVPTETPADDDFLVFPPQGALPPKSSQVIRVQWLGDPTLRSSRSYYLEVRQIPVPLGTTPGTTGAGAQLQITYRIKALLTVAPHGATPKVFVRQAVATMIEPRRQTAVPTDAAAPPPKAPGIQVTLQNEGTRHALMGGLTWIVEGTGPDGHTFRVTVPRATISAAIGAGYLPPDGAQRVFSIPFDTPSKGDLTVRFTE
ncbi:MAG TPA: fimbria/pilus periplasmic chaperone [Caulobacteraceae bacterium]|jgi:fimbrial chaperone protein|nr:fimbria/pilus periplasmic chaperone [Caulobacteraceae bacterium]